MLGSDRTRERVAVRDGLARERAVRYMWFVVDTSPPPSTGDASNLLKWWDDGCGLSWKPKCESVIVCEF